MSLSEMLKKPVRNEEFRVSGERFVDFTLVFIAFGAHSKEQLFGGVENHQGRVFFWVQKTLKKPGWNEECGLLARVL